jgi:hypothetical protein
MQETVNWRSVRMPESHMAQWWLVGLRVIVLTQVLFMQKGNRARNIDISLYIYIEREIEIEIEIEIETDT